MTGIILAGLAGAAFGYYYRKFWEVIEGSTIHITTEKLP
jgi:hypothetical protein